MGICTLLPRWLPCNRGDEGLSITPLWRGHCSRGDDGEIALGMLALVCGGVLLVVVQPVFDEVIGAGVFELSVLMVVRGVVGVEEEGETSDTLRVDGRTEL